MPSLPLLAMTMMIERPKILEVLESADVKHFGLDRQHRDELVAYLAYLEDNVKSRDEACEIMSEQIELLETIGNQLASYVETRTLLDQMMCVSRWTDAVRDWADESK